jgi:hypothetical protein
MADASQALRLAPCDELAMDQLFTGVEALERRDRRDRGVETMR